VHAPSGRDLGFFTLVKFVHLQPFYFDRRVLSRPLPTRLRFADINHVAYHLENVFSVGFGTVAIRQSNRSVALRSKLYRAFCEVQFQLFVHSYKKRKDGAPFLEMVQANITLKVGHPPHCYHWREERAHESGYNWKGVH